MKVHVVTSANRVLYEQEIGAMHRMRYDVFVRHCGWKEGIITDGIHEHDNYDDNSAVYLLAMQGSTLLGSLRMLPTWRRSMIDEVWPQLVQAKARAGGPDIWEMSRLCIDLKVGKPLQLEIRLALFLATAEFGASRNATAFIAMSLLRHVCFTEELDWRPLPLGLPRDIDGFQCMAFGWENRPNMADETRKRIGFTKTVAMEVAAGGGRLASPRMMEWLYEAESLDPFELEAVMAEVQAKRAAAVH